MLRHPINALMGWSTSDHWIEAGRTIAPQEGPVWEEVGVDASGVIPQVHLDQGPHGISARLQSCFLGAADDFSQCS